MWNKAWRGKIKRLLRHSEEWRLIPDPACHLSHIVGYCPRSLLQTCRFFHPLNHCLCCWLQTFSSVLKLGKQRPYRPMGNSPTIGGAARRLRKLLWPLRCREIQDKEWKVSWSVRLHVGPTVAGVKPGRLSANIWNLLHLHYTHTTDLPTYLPQGQLLIVLITMGPVMRDRPLCWFPW